MSIPRVGSSKKEDFRLGHQPAGQQDFLLISAAQVFNRRIQRRRLDLHLVDEPVAAFIDFLLIDQSEAVQEVVVTGNCDVDMDRERPVYSVHPPVFGQESHPLPDCVAWLPDFYWIAVNPDFTDD